MKYKTLKNMEKVTRMIVDKGYEWDKANSIAINCFEEAKRNKRSIEFIISLIRDNDKI